MMMMLMMMMYLCVDGVAPLILPPPPEDEVRVKKEKVAKIVNSAPTMLLDKPIVTDVDYYNIDLSWTPASLPPNSTPTSFTYSLTSLSRHIPSKVYFWREARLAR